ncbi:hypothetical protein ZWY2020_049374 [Hordeum vulgare]|nr:hypothetical protein ZWY2020_049374 [Hordeum vulgare]
MGIAAPVVGHPLPLGDVAPLLNGPALLPVAPLIVGPDDLLDGPALLPVAPLIDGVDPLIVGPAPLLDGPDLLPVAPLIDGVDPLLDGPAPLLDVHPGLALLPLGPHVDQDPNDDLALDALPPMNVAPFLAYDDIEGNPNPWVQVKRRRPPQQQAHLVAPVDNTGDVDYLEDNTVDEFKDVFWLTKITQRRVSRRSTNSRRRALVGVRSGPGVFVFNY